MLAVRAMFPPAPALDQEALERAIEEVMSSATPPPALSAYVFSVIQPSLVLIESAIDDETGLGAV